jgi:hypothetical protein
MKSSKRLHSASKNVQDVFGGIATTTIQRERMATWIVSGEPLVLITGILEYQGKSGCRIVSILVVGRHIEWDSSRE